MIIDRYIIVDWSASNRPRVGKDSIWILCVPKTSSMACEQAIFVDQASGARVFSDAVLLKRDKRSW